MVVKREDGRRLLLCLVWCSIWLLTFCSTYAGKIEVHSPHKLESQVLQNYFRHSKFASFQRQLNYFGFRKLAGKGKMAPCSYVNEMAGHDIPSLLLIKVRVVVIIDTWRRCLVRFDSNTN